MQDLVPKPCPSLCPPPCTVPTAWHSVPLGVTASTSDLKATALYPSPSETPGPGVGRLGPSTHKDTHRIIDTHIQTHKHTETHLPPPASLADAENSYSLSCGVPRLRIKTPQKRNSTVSGCSGNPASHTPVSPKGKPAPCKVSRPRGAGGGHVRPCGSTSQLIPGSQGAPMAAFAGSRLGPSKASHHILLPRGHVHVRGGTGLLVCSQGPPDLCPPHTLSCHPPPFFNV